VVPVDVTAGRVLQYAFKHQDVRTKAELVANTTSLMSWQRFQDVMKLNSETEFGMKVDFVQARKWLDLL
jgi:hypothetical protein